MLLILILDLVPDAEVGLLLRGEHLDIVVTELHVDDQGAVGAGLLGILLQISGFIPTTEGAAAVAQPASAIFMIRCLYSLVPMILMIITILAARHFNKLSKQMPQIEKELKERREAEA